jgi:hypothetical protein
MSAGREIMLSRRETMVSALPRIVSGAAIMDSGLQTMRSCAEQMISGAETMRSREELMVSGGFPIFRLAPRRSTVGGWTRSRWTSPAR